MPADEYAKLVESIRQEAADLKASLGSM
jgi:hypothetical protein